MNKNRCEVPLTSGTTTKTKKAVKEKYLKPPSLKIKNMSI